MIADELRAHIAACEKQIALVRELLELLGTDTEPAGDHRCGACGRSFKSAAGLGRHRTTVCADNPPAASPPPAPPSNGFHPVFECDECEYGADSATKMISHSIEVHHRRPTNEERTPKAAAA